MDKIELLKIKTDMVTKCLPEAPFRSIVAGLYDDLFAEIKERDEKITALRKHIPE